MPRRNRLTRAATAGGTRSMHLGWQTRGSVKWAGRACRRAVWREDSGLIRPHTLSFPYRLWHPEMRSTTATTLK